ncbi:MAG: phospholipase D family protein [Desulfotomaculaceae bacterium]|nr:phospholipase D family protein [Desulfotomaculaceae bacterium]
MFRPAEDRLDYANILAPPAGYKCEFAIGTTYSLDLEALIGVPLALFLGEEMDGTLLENPVYVLEALRKSADKFALFCEGGQIKAPLKANPVFALLESSIFEVALKNEKSFHPKVWLIKYMDANEKELYRFIVLSRNLTFDRSWDAAVVLEGEAGGRITLKNRPLIDFLTYLQGSANDKKKKRLIGRIAGELSYVYFQTGDKRYADFSFLPLGIGEVYNKDSTGVFDSYQDLLVFSPFLSRDTVMELDGLSLKNAHKTLITRRSEISKLTNELLASFACYCLKDTVIDGETALSESEEAADLQKQDIHAKIYFKSKYSEHNIYIGSANCSRRAWDGNVEFMLRLKYEKRGFRIWQIIDELFGRNNEDYDERQNPFEQVVAVPEAAVVQEDLQERLQKAIKRLCRSRTSALVIENNSKYDISIQFDRRFIAADVDLSIAALGGGKSVKLESATLISGLSLLELGEFYIVTAGIGEDSLARVIKIRTKGIPAERDGMVFKSIIKDQNAFLRYVAFLLSDDYLLAALEQAEQKEASAKGWYLHGYDMPVLYESMLRAAARSPEKLREIDAIIQRLNDQDIVPPEFEKLYTTFLKASRRIKT